MSMSRILITGISGFIGEHLLPSLLKKGHTICGVGRSTVYKNTDIEYHIYDLSIHKAETNFSFLGPQDVCIHLAATTEHEKIVTFAQNNLINTINGIINALEMFVATGGSNFIYASTGKVYGSGSPVPYREDSRCEPLNVLGESKYIGERIVHYYSKLYPQKKPLQF